MPLVFLNTAPEEVLVEESEAV
jgi:uncharacterized protein with HEPN domain